MKFSIGNNLVPHGLLPFCFLTIFDIFDAAKKALVAADRNPLQFRKKLML